MSRELIAAVYQTKIHNADNLQDVCVTSVVHIHRTPNWLKDWSWTEEAWTGDDEPYKQIQKGIAIAFVNKQNGFALLSNYKALALRNPHDPKAQFRWAYSALTMASWPEVGSKALEGTRDALDDAPSPHTYRYTRLRYLVESAIIPFDQLRRLGTRLLAHNPDGYVVKYRVASSLESSQLATDRRKGFAYAQDLVRLHPQEPSYYALLGAGYYRLWKVDHEPGAIDKAIAAYQYFLQIAPPNDYFRASAQILIDSMQREKNVA